MNGKRSFVVASILCLHDTCFLYPACQKCGSQLLINHGRFQCPKRGCVSVAQNMNYRYRLSVKVAGKSDIFNITVFGSCLEPYFGAAAGFLHRYCEDLKKELQEPEGEKVQDLLVQAVEHCFIGRSFIFGVKASESQTGLLSFSENLLQTTISRSKYKKYLVACQIAVPNTAVFGCTVINYYKKLLDSASLKDLPPSSLLSDSLLITVDQSSTMINSLTSSMSGNTRSYTQLSSANRLSSPWQQDFALTSSSFDCITVEGFSTAETSRVGSKWNIRPPDHVEEATQNRKCNKSTLSTSQNSSDLSGCNTNAMVSLPYSLEVQRLPNNDCTSQCYSTNFDELQEDCLKSSFNTQRCYVQKPGVSLSNGKGSDEFQSANKSCSLQDSLDYNDSILWDDLLFSESLGEFIAKVEENQQRCDEEIALLTSATVVDGSVHSCSWTKLEIDNPQNGAQGQNTRYREVSTHSANCNLIGSRKTGNKKTSYPVDSNNSKDVLEGLVLVDGFKSDDVTEKEVPLATASPLWSGDDSDNVHTPSPEAVVQICMAFMNSVSASNCNTQPVQTCGPNLPNLQEEQVGECSSFLPKHKTTEATKPTDLFHTTNESYLLKNVDFQTLLPSSKQLLKMEKRFDSKFQDQKCIKGHNFDKCDMEPVGRSQLSSVFNLHKNSSFQNSCTNPTEKEYDISGDLFNDTGGNKEEPSLCLKANLSILSKQTLAAKACKTNCKPNEQQCNISLCLNGAADAVGNQNNNSSPENDSQNMSEHDFSDSEDFVPFSQSTPVSRFQILKSFRGRENKALMMSPYVRTSPRSAAFRQRQVGLFKNGQLKQQSLHIQKMFQQQSGSNQTSVSSNSSLLSNSPISKSYESDSDEWIPPSTTKTRIMSSHLSSCVFNIHKSRSVKLFTHVSYACAATETADSTATTESNKENDSSSQCRGDLYMKRPPAGKHTKPSLQQKVFNSTKVLQNEMEKLEPFVSSEIQIRKGLKVNDCTPTAFYSFYTKSETLSCCSPELFTASAELFEEEYQSL